MFSVLMYSKLLICLDPDKELEFYSRSDYIHLWHYVNKIRMKYPYIISWDELIKRLPGTKLQVARMIEYIMGMPENNLKYYISYYYKLDLYLIPLIGKFRYKLYGKYLGFWKSDHIKDPQLTLRVLIKFIKHDISDSKARAIVYWHRFHLPEFKITSENWKVVLYMLEYYPKLAQLPWLVDIQNYIDIDPDGEYWEIILNLCANPKINKDKFKRFTELYSCFDRYCAEDLLPKYIQNMFRFRMREGMGIELNYPHCGIKEDTKEWRIKLYLLNINLTNLIKSYDHDSLICSIPGRHTEYLSYEDDYLQLGFKSDLGHKMVRLLLE